MASTDERLGRLDPGAAQYAYRRFAPPADLARWVAWHWWVSWDLRAPYAAEVLPFPSANLTVGSERAGLHGVFTRRFVATLEGVGWTLGTLLRPGACRALIDQPAHAITDRVIGIPEAFGAAGAAFVREADEATRRTPEDPQGCVDAAGRFLRARLRGGAEIDQAIALVELAQQDRAVLRVDELAARAGRTVRAVERVFREHVGVSPKWVLRRFRVHEAVLRAAAGERLDWAALAIELGYVDQAHLIREFKAQVGATPQVYADRQRAPTDAA